VAAVSASFAEAFKGQMQACMGVAAATVVVGLLAYQKNPPTLVKPTHNAGELQSPGAQVEHGEA